MTQTIKQLRQQKMKQLTELAKNDLSKIYNFMDKQLDDPAVKKQLVNNGSFKMNIFKIPDLNLPKGKSELKNFFNILDWMNHQKQDAMLTAFSSYYHTAFHKQGLDLHIISVESFTYS